MLIWVLHRGRRRSAAESERDNYSEQQNEPRHASVRSRDRRSLAYERALVLERCDFGAGLGSGSTFGRQVRFHLELSDFAWDHVATS
jgi:hypothetical protein